MQNLTVLAYERLNPDSEYVCMLRKDESVLSLEPHWLGVTSEPGGAGGAKSALGRPHSSTLQERFLRRSRSDPCAAEGANCALGRPYSGSFQERILR